MKRRNATFIEQFFSFSLITPFVLLAIFILSLIVNSAVEDSCVIDWFTYAYSIFSGLLFALVLYIFAKEKTNTKFYVTFVPYFLIFTTIVCTVFKKTNDLAVIIPVCVVQFVLQLFVNELFLMHDFFIAHWEGKTGKELKELLYHQSVDSSDNAHSIKKFQTILTTICIIYFFLCMIIKKVNVSFNILLLVNTIVFIVNAFYGFYLIGYFNRESIYANMGYDVVVKNNSLFHKVIISIFVLAMMIAVVFSRNEALLHLNFQSTQTITAPQEYEIQVPENDYVEYDEKEIDLSEKGGDFKDSYFLAMIIKVIEIVCFIILIVCLWAFFFKPFRESGWKNFWKENKLKFYIKKLIDDIKTFFIDIFTKKDKEYATIQAASFKNAIQNLLHKSKKSKEKRIELDRLTKQFMKIIDWGAKREIIYKNTLAPAEYTQLIEDFIEKNGDFNTEDKISFKNDAHTIGSLFEKALYDKELLSKEEEKIFLQKIDTILTL